MRKKGELPFFVAHRYGDFARMHKRLRQELPGKILPALPKKNKQSAAASGLFSGMMGGSTPMGSDDSSVSSVSTAATGPATLGVPGAPDAGSSATSSMRNLSLSVKGHMRSASATSLGVVTPSSRSSVDSRRPTPPSGVEGEMVILYRESQRISLRAFLRSLLGNPDIARSRTIEDFLTLQHIQPTDEDVVDIDKRRLADEKRLEEQKQFYEIARKRAAELDVFMEQ